MKIKYFCVVIEEIAPLEIGQNCVTKFDQQPTEAYIEHKIEPVKKKQLVSNLTIFYINGIGLATFY